MVERSRQRIWERSSIPGRRQRISSPQQNQENSGEAEEQMMREELDSAWVRHAGEGGEVMDETPPRLGRIERRMREE
ncbi:hypothetical protein P154DRAFT_521377 [Amniculicola lignicola CBS 123094]|uniref:Uncharacterized protein n=1 Tax=Amniculicola lignicola CBS 123094 TaxID=1392246 RepID=A0A6A5WS67_9PLEO|nr:hypothetical protein P154DRAFT_521377 [Amniculicola lignicola CBS 123094]